MPFKTALEKFLKANAEKRSEFRTTLVSKESSLKDCFKDENNELSFKKIVDINELKIKFEKHQIPINPEINDDLSAILLCFGCIEIEKRWCNQVPIDTPEETKARVNLESREKKLEDSRQQREKDLKTKKVVSKEEEKKRSDEEAKLMQEIAEFKAQLKPKKPEKIRLNLTSLHDLMQSIDKMAEFDRNLSYWGII